MNPIFQPTLCFLEYKSDMPAVRISDFERLTTQKILSRRFVRAVHVLLTLFENSEVTCIISCMFAMSRYCGDTEFDEKALNSV